MNNNNRVSNAKISFRNYQMFYLFRFYIFIYLIQRFFFLFFFFVTAFILEFLGLIYILVLIKSTLFFKSEQRREYNGGIRVFSK